MKTKEINHSEKIRKACYSVLDEKIDQLKLLIKEKKVAKQVLH